MTPDQWNVHPLSASDLPEMFGLDNAAFHIDPPADFLDDVVRPMVEIDRLTGVRDPEPDGSLVGSAAIQSRRMTFPGAGPHPVAAVTYVAVRAGWRRRGILSALMRDQLHGLHERAGEPVAILTASEGVIYGRYGYGRAMDRAEIKLPHGAAFAAGVPTAPVRELDAGTAAARARSLWDRIAPVRPGQLSRTDGIWQARFAEHDFMSRGLSQRRWAGLPDGVMGYRVRPGWVDRDGQWTVVVTDLIAATPLAHASLWRFLLDLDLTDRVEYPLGWTDDPVQDLLADRRSLSLIPNDHVWLRIVDLDRAVSLRAYSATVTVHVELVDDFCPWNTGSWQLELGPDGGRAVRGTGPGDLRINTRDLAACFLGGTPVARLVAGGLVSGAPEAVHRLGAALAAPIAPWCPEAF